MHTVVFFIIDVSSKTKISNLDSEFFIQPREMTRSIICNWSVADLQWRWIIMSDLHFWDCDFGRQYFILDLLTNVTVKQKLQQSKFDTHLTQWMNSGNYWYCFDNIIWITVLLKQLLCVKRYILVECYIISSTAVSCSVSLEISHFYFQVKAWLLVFTLNLDKEGPTSISVTAHIL